MTKQQILEWYARAKYQVKNRRELSMKDRRACSDSIEREFVKLKREFNRTLSPQSNSQ